MTTTLLVLFAHQVTARQQMLRAGSFEHAVMHEKVTEGCFWDIACKSAAGLTKTEMSEVKDKGNCNNCIRQLGSDLPPKVFNKSGKLRKKKCLQHLSKPEHRTKDLRILCRNNALGALYEMQKSSGMKQNDKEDRKLANEQSVSRTDDNTVYTQYAEPAKKFKRKFKWLRKYQQEYEKLKDEPKKTVKDQSAADVVVQNIHQIFVPPPQKIKQPYVVFVPQQSNPPIDMASTSILSKDPERLIASVKRGPFKSGLPKPTTIDSFLHISGYDSLLVGKPKKEQLYLIKQAVGGGLSGIGGAGYSAACDPRNPSGVGVVAWNGNANRHGKTLLAHEMGHHFQAMGGVTMMTALARVMEYHNVLLNENAYRASCSLMQRLTYAGDYQDHINWAKRPDFVAFMGFQRAPENKEQVKALVADKFSSWVTNALSVQGCEISNALVEMECATLSPTTARLLSEIAGELEKDSYSIKSATNFALNMIGEVMNDFAKTKMKV